MVRHLLRLSSLWLSPATRSILIVNRATLSSKVSRITHVIFDLDGTLIDSEKIYAGVNARVMAKYGKQFNPEVYKLIMGMTRNAGFPILLEKTGLKDIVSLDEYNAQFEAILPEVLPQCPLMPGAMTFVRHLAKHHIPMAICTGSQLFECQLKLRSHKELTDLIPLLVSGEDPAILRGKPSPDAFIITASRFSPNPKKAEDVIVFEDSPNGVRAAIAAGMHVAMMPDPQYVTPPEDVKDRIDCVMKSFEDLKPESVGLPPY